MFTIVNRNGLIALLAVTTSMFFVSCGTILPDRLIYPTDMKSLDEDKDKEITPSQVGEAEKPANGDDKVIFGKPETGGSQAATEGLKPTYLAEEKKEKEAAETGSSLSAKNRSKKPAVDAEHSDIGHNVLTRAFNAGFDEVWDGVVETMMPLNLSAIDKSSGVLITGWIQDSRLKNQTAALQGIIGDTIRYVRYKYIVRVVDEGLSTRVTIVPFAQVSKNRRWHQGKPAIVITEMLMRKFIEKMEG